MSDQPAPKGKLALYWAASCGGCEIAVLAIDEKILDIAKAFDIVLLAGGDRLPRSMTSRQMPDKGIDLCLFNGAIRNERAGVHGPAAASASRRSWWPSAPAPRRAGSPAWRTCTIADAHLPDYVYNDIAVCRTTRKGIRPQLRDSRRPRAHCTCRCCYDTVKTLAIRRSTWITSLPGCPPEPENIYAIVQAVVARPDRQTSAAGRLGPRQADDGLRRVQAHPRREEDYRLQAHLADHS